jgi:methionyl-tRNA formyltransferase
MRAIFLGTPEFAVPTLESLVEAGHQVEAVYTQPDRPKGRGGQIAASPVKEAAVRLNLRVAQPERIKRPENVAELVALKPDVMVVVGYGQIIPQQIIDIPRHGILNVHASLLPKYRGAAPIQWAIAHGERETGVTIMRIDAGLDTGDMLLKWTATIEADETAPMLSRRLAPAGATLLLNALSHIEAGTATYEKQNEHEATHAPILKKEDGRVNWSRTAVQIENRLRGFTPWPGAFTTLRGKTLQIFQASVATPMAGVETGTAIVMNRQLFVACGGESALELHELQLEGKKKMSVDAFLNGYGINSGEVLGGNN